MLEAVSRAALLGILAVAACDGGDDVTSTADAMPRPDAGPDASLSGGPLDPLVLHQISITIAAGDRASFDEDQANRVPCDVTWDGELLAQAGCRKKGSAGSVDAYTGKPAFSIKFDHLVPGQKLGAFDRMSLDNALQDSTLLDEVVAYQTFRRAGLPAHRTAMAVVTLDGVARGIYIAVEPYDKEFLRDRFGDGNGDGNLYESLAADFAVDPANMELKDPDGRSRADLDALAAAVDTAPDATFVAEVGALLDLDQAITFIAAELALDAEDGFALGRNNYYLYHRPDTDRFVLLPHGQDDVLRNPELEPDYPLPARLAARIREIPELSAQLDAALAAMVAPGGAFDAAALAATIEIARAAGTSSGRTDPFTAGDERNLTAGAPIAAGQIAWRGARIRGEVELGTCGDGVVHQTEQCDDGDTAPGDGCDADCLPECETINDGGTAWRVCPAAVDQPTAAAACTARGGTLVVPADPADAAAIALEVRRRLGSADVWLGLTDAATEDTWVDGDGAAAPYLGFTPTEPNGGTAEACAVLDTGTQGGWYDQACDVSYAALCRLPP